MVKHLPAKRETWVQFLGWEDPLEKEMATHSSTLAWRIPWTKDPGRLQSMGSQRVRHNWATSLSFFRSYRDYTEKWELSGQWALATGENTAVSGAPLSACWWFKPLTSASPSGTVEQVERVEVTSAKAIIFGRVWGAPGAHCLPCPVAVASRMHNSGYKEITRAFKAASVTTSTKSISWHIQKQVTTILLIQIIMDWMFACHPSLPPRHQFKCLNLMPKVMVLGGGTVGRWLGHEGEASWKWVMLL